jgi:hypothetical protein
MDWPIFVPSLINPEKFLYSGSALFFGLLNIDFLTGRSLGTGSIRCYDLRLLNKKKLDGTFAL